MDHRGKYNLKAKDGRKRERYRVDSYYDNPGYGFGEDDHHPYFHLKDHMHQRVPRRLSNHYFPDHDYVDVDYTNDNYSSASGSIARSDVGLTKGSHDKARKTKICIIVSVVIGVLVIVGASVAVAVHFSSFTDVIQTTPSAPTQTEYEGTFSMGLDWDSELADKNSAKYQELAQNVTAMLDSVYGGSNQLNGAEYVRAEITEFKQGSIIVVFILVYSHQPGSPPSAATVTAVLVVQASSGNNIAMVKLGVIASSVQFTVRPPQPTATTPQLTTIQPTTTTTQPATTPPQPTTTTPQPTTTTPQGTTTTTTQLPTTMKPHPTTTTPQPTTTTPQPTTSTPLPTTTTPQPTTSTPQPTTSTPQPTTTTTSTPTTTPQTTTTMMQPTTTTTQPGCVQTYNERSGTVQSPNYPQNYPSNSDCVYNINSPGNPPLPITLTFVAFNLEVDASCSADFLQVFDSSNDTLLGKFCGVSIPDPVVAFSGSMRLEFVSDDSVQRSGFQAKFTDIPVTTTTTTPAPSTSSTTTGPTTPSTTTPAGCDRSYIASDGEIRSPNYPNEYPSNSDCTYEIMSPKTPRQPITLIFNDFNVEFHSSCIYDSVEVSDAVTNTLLGTFCGPTIPPVVTANSGLMKVVFKSDASFERTGFRATFTDSPVTTTVPTTTTNAGGCNEYMSASSGTFTSPEYPNNYPTFTECYFHINVQSGYIIILKFTDFVTETTWDYVQVFDGNSASSKELARLDGEVGLKVFVSSGSSMTVYFQSDTSLTEKGFMATYVAIEKGCETDQTSCSPGITDAPCVGIQNLCDATSHCQNDFDEQYCANYTVVSTTTSVPTTIPPGIDGVRLADGSSCLDGRLEFNKNGVWGTVAVTSLSGNVLNLICNTLGFRNGGLSSSSYKKADDSVPIWYTNFVCFSSHSSLGQCIGVNSGSGSHLDDIGVRCFDYSETDYKCTFDEGEGSCMDETTPTDDEPNWEYTSGSTPSFGTGPSSGVFETDTYRFLETSYCSENAFAELAIPALDDSSDRCLTFFYHMYGNNINKLQVNISIPSEPDKMLWVKEGPQGNQWHYSELDLPRIPGKMLEVKFIGFCGESFRGDIALDDVVIYEGTCKSYRGNICESVIDEPSNVNCSFDTVKACDYSKQTVNGTIQWLYKSSETEGPILQHPAQRNQGYFYYDNRNGAPQDSARLISPEFQSSSTLYLRFDSYHATSGKGSLEVLFTSSGTSLWQSTGEEGSGWLSACVPLKSNSTETVAFVATKSTEYDFFVAVDNVSVSNKECTSGIVDKVCDMEQPYDCGYMMNCSSCDFKWMRHAGATTTSMTGPADADFYMYADARFGNTGDKALVSFPEFTGKGSQNLMFRYHMYGANTGTLLVQSEVDNSVSQIWSASGSQGNEWNLICLQLSNINGKNVELSFVAERGDGVLGDIAIDDILVTGDECPHTATCDFSFGMCKYSNVSDDSFHWQRGQLNTVPDNDKMGAYYHVTSHAGFEGHWAALVSPPFTAEEAESVTFEYINTEFTRFEVGWINGGQNLLDMQLSLVTSVFTTTNAALKWNKRCLSLGGVTGNIRLVFIHKSGILSSQFSAVDNIKVAKSACLDGIYESVCGFNPSDLCGFEIATEDECQTAKSFRWQRVELQRDYVMAVNGTNGRIGDSTSLYFPPPPSGMETYLHFSYFIENGNDPNILTLLDTSSANQVTVIDSNPTFSLWQNFCINTTGHSWTFEAKKTSNDTKLYLDDVTISKDPCPERSFGCDFNNNNCGYNHGYEWRRTEKASGDFYMGNYEYAISKSTLLSPEVDTKANSQCLEFSYRFPASSFSHFRATLYRNNSAANTFSLSGTDSWETFRHQTKEAFDYVAWEVDPSENINGRGELAAIDDVSLTEGQCVPTACKSGEMACSSGLQCISVSAACDGTKHCFDGSDEEDCKGSIACDFEGLRRCEYELTDGVVREGTASSGHYISAATQGFKKLTSAEVYVPEESCLLFLARSTIELTNFHLGLVKKDKNGSLKALKHFSKAPQKELWLQYASTIPSGNFSIVFEMNFAIQSLLGFLHIDDIKVQSGPCTDDCPGGFFCKKDQYCLPERYSCDSEWHCSDGEDEADCRENDMTCKFETENSCGYKNESGWRSGFIQYSGSSLSDHTKQSTPGSYMYVGDWSGLYEDSRLMSPSVQSDKDLCVEFFFAVLRPEEYSTTYLYLYQNLTAGNYIPVFRHFGYHQSMNWEWMRGEFLLHAGYSNLEFLASGYRSYLAVDDVVVFEGDCGGQMSTTTPGGNQTTLQTTSTMQITTTTLPPSTTMQSTTQSSGGCYQFSYSFCSKPYNMSKTIFPNIFGKEDYATTKAFGNVHFFGFYPSNNCERLYSNLLCGMLFPRCDNGTAVQICKQSCLDALQLLNTSCPYTTYPVNIGNYDHYCNHLPDNNCYSLPDYVIGTTQAPLQTTTAVPITAVSHIRMLKTTKDSEIQGIIESVVNGRFGYLSCNDDIYCPSLICHRFGYSHGTRDGYIFRSGQVLYATCSDTSRQISDCRFTDIEFSFAYKITCIDVQEIDCKFGSSNEGQCRYTTIRSGATRNNAYSLWLVSSGGTAVDLIRSQLFTTPSGGSLKVNLYVLKTDAQIGFQLRDLNDMVYDLGSVKYGDTEVCFDLPSSVTGFLYITGQVESVVTNYVVDLLEIEVNKEEKCSDPFPSGVCEYDSKCPYKIECADRIGDPHPFQWDWKYDSDKKLQFLTADSSFGGQGHTAMFTLPLNATAKHNLRFRYRNTEENEPSSNWLEVNVMNQGTSKNFLNKSLDTFGSWESACVSISEEVINGQLEFKTTRGFSAVDDTQVDSTEITTEFCPHPVTCDFQSEKICNYVTKSNSSFKWLWGSYNRDSSNNFSMPEADHTEGSDKGSYMYTATCWQGAGEGDIATLSTPVFKSSSSTPMKVSFYYHMSGANIRKFQTFINEHGDTQESSLVFSISGSHSNEWYYACVDLPQEDVEVSLTFSTERGDGCESVYAVDDVEISEGACLESLNEVTCHFDPTNTCQFSTSSTDGSEYHWSRQMAMTSNAEPFGDADGYMAGHYAYVNGSNGQQNDKSTLSYPAFTTGNQSSLRFSFYMNGDNVGRLDVISQVTATSVMNQLWTKTGHQDTYWVKECVALTPNTEQNILFTATRLSENGDIAIDNVYVVDRPCPGDSMPFDFDEDDAYLCGFINSTYRHPSEGWIPVTDHRIARSTHGSGKYMWTNSASTWLISPPMSMNGPSCASFKYRTSQSHKLEFITYHNSTSSSVFSMNRSTDDTWRLVQFDLKPMDNFRLMGSLAAAGPGSGIDDISINPGQCTTLVCTDQFSCGSYCIESKKVCDREPDCDNGEDEKNCPSSFACNFQDPFLCGYYSVGTSEKLEQKKAIYQNMMYDHTYSNISGRFFGVVNYLDDNFTFKSRPDIINLTSCLSLYYRGNVDTFSFRARYLDRNISDPGKYTFSDQTSDQYLDLWRLTQITLEPGEVELEFNLTHGSADVKYFGIDDVDLTPGECPPLSCPRGLMPCLRDGICIQENILCDNQNQCPSGEDESNCPKSLSCDFEFPYACGYIFSSLFVYTKPHEIGIPYKDNTYGNSSGHFMYFHSSTQQVSTLSSPENTMTMGGCVKFHYNLWGQGSAELKTYVTTGGTKHMVFYSNGIDFRTHEWREASFQISSGNIRIDFEAYGDIYNHHYSSVAIDDVMFVEGQNCTAQAACDKTEQLECESSGVCLPAFLSRNGFSDCLDGSDEKFEKPDGVYSVCTFEPADGIWCDFNDNSQDELDWRVHTGATGSSNTGPNAASSGSYYLYLEVSSTDEGERARYETKQLSADTEKCLSFSYHMYGLDIGSLNVFAEFDSGTSLQLFMKNSSQEDATSWNHENINIPAMAGKKYKVVFNGVAGNGFRGDIALDDIKLLSCGMNFTIPEFSMDPSVRLIGGPVTASGRLEIQPNSEAYFSPVCAERWDMNDTTVVCKQLGYTGKSRYFEKSIYGKGRLSRNQFGYEFNCLGTESSLSECPYELSQTVCRGERVAVECTNGVCYNDDKSCQDDKGTCISSDLWCNGFVDCSNEKDENDCGTCAADEFKCGNHECKPKSNRCDGVGQCKDNSDEHFCVIKTDEGEVKVYRDEVWKSICFREDVPLAKHLCSVTGFGEYISLAPGDDDVDGLQLTPGNNPRGLITNYNFAEATCKPLKINCYDIECGLSIHSAPQVSEFVFYGNDAVNGEHPWLCLMSIFSTSYFCAATLIDTKYAIVPAHCVVDFSVFDLLCGEVNKTTLTTTENSNVQKRRVAEAIVHPDFARGDNNYLSDFAILKLGEPVDYSDFVRPACISSEVLPSSYSKCFTMGFGTDETTGYPDILQEVEVTIIQDVDRCNITYQNAYEFPLPASAICVDNSNPHEPTCFADSGAPLMCQNSYGRWEVVAITSVGSDGCSLHNAPTIYQSVPYHVEWISQNTNIQFGGS